MRASLPAWWWMLVPVLAGAAEADPLAQLRQEHPRLLVTHDALATIVAEAKVDPLRAKLHAAVVRSAESLLGEPAISYTLVGPRMLDQSRQALAHVTTCAMAWHLSGDPRFAGHARDVMLAAAAFPDWNPSHFLDVAEMATALALGYDWLHDWLSVTERTTIKRALLDKALAYVDHAYARADPNRESYPFVKGNLTNNWNQVCNAGFVLAALALAEDEPALLRRVLAGLQETLPSAMAAYAPDGAYPEGPVYWGYGTRFNILILAALESALGDDLGLSQQPAFDRTDWFRYYVQSPTGLSFNFADGRAGLGVDSSLTWLGRRFQHPAVVAFNRGVLAAELEKPQVLRDRLLATHVLWFPAEVADESVPPLDVIFDGPSKLALFRSAWDDEQAIWTGLKAGSNRVNHGHLDAGSFMIDADGERWAVDLGPDDYNLPGYWNGATIDSPRWQYFRLNNRSHNTITPGDFLQSPDADVPFIASGFSPARAFVVADLTSAYPTQARSFQRGLALLERQRVLVQDEVTAPVRGTTLTWRMFTGAEIALEGASARLSQNGEEMRVTILAPEPARFVVEAARPATSAENQNDGIGALVITLPPSPAGATVSTIAVLLTPGSIVTGPPMADPVITPLATWR